MLQLQPAAIADARASLLAAACVARMRTAPLLCCTQPRLRIASGVHRQAEGGPLARDGWMSSSSSATPAAATTFIRDVTRLRQVSSGRLACVLLSVGGLARRMLSAARRLLVAGGMH